MRDYLISDKSVYHIISSSDNVELVRYDIGSSKNEKNVSIKSTINTGSKVYKIIKICDGAFANCARMETVTIPDDVEEIGKAAFLNCISLKSIVIPEKIEKLDDEVFKNCINLRTLRLKNNNLTHIGVSAFEGCVKLKNISNCSGLHPSRAKNTLPSKTLRIA